MAMAAIGLDKRSVLRLATMVEARLVWHEHLAPWADELISTLPSPPQWLLQLSTAQYQPEVARILLAEAHAPPEERVHEDEVVDEFLACLLLRHQRRELSWATFLREAGYKLDGTNVPRRCEDLYALLTDLEHHEWAEETERAQRASVERELASAVARIEPPYRVLLEFYRQSRSRA
jgi:hypothetical protein